MSTKQILRFFTIIIVCSSQVLPVYAAEEPIAPTSYSDTLPPGLQSCFDYYRFGSVPVTINSDTTQLAQGAQLHLNAVLHNENAYPISNVALYIKIFYKKNFDKSSFGPDVIDVIKVADNIQLPADGRTGITYTYNLPADLEPGSYQVAGYVNASERYNLSGLSFTNDIVGSLFNFTVVGENGGAVRFDNTKTVAGSVGYHAAIFSPRATYTKEGFPISVVLNNTSQKNFAGTVEWTVYSWDSINSKNVLKRDSQPVQLGAQASTTLAYTVTDKTHSVYYVVGKLMKKGSPETQSVISVRYIQDSEEMNPTPRIAFSGITAYPTKRGSTSAFACVHSSGSSSAPDSKVVLEAIPTDPIDWIFHLGTFGRKEYHGVIPGELSAVSFPLNADASNIKIRVSLYQKGSLIDSVETSYSCAAFEKHCPVSRYWMLFGGGILISLLLLLVVRKRKAPVQATTL